MPRKHCRTFLRSRKKHILTKDTRKVLLVRWNGTSITISQRQAERMESSGEAVKVAGETPYWKAVVAEPSRPSPTTLTRGTMDAVAKASKQDRLSGAERRQVEKFKVWPLIGDTKAIAVRPRISADDRREAQALLGIRAA